MNIDEVKSLLKNSPAGQITLWVIYYEDLYETKFGDGFFSYPIRAFLNQNEAEKWASLVTLNSNKEGTMGCNTEVHQVVVLLNDVEQFCFLSRGKDLSIIDPEKTILNLLNGTHPDWQSIVKGHD